MRNLESVENKKGLAGELYSLLADTYTMYFRVQSCHWNVEGSDFHEYHGFFGMIYDDLGSAIDPIAENIRKLGFQAPMNLHDMCAATMIQEEQLSPDPLSMVSSLLAANGIVISRLYSAIVVAREIMQPAIENFLADRLGMHQKWEWQLNSTLNRGSIGMPGKAIADQPIGVSVVDMSDQLFVEYDTDEGGMYASAKIKFSDKVEKILSDKTAAYNKKAPANRVLSVDQLRAVYRRGANSHTLAHSGSVSRESLAMARVDQFLKLSGLQKIYDISSSQDSDLLPVSHPKSRKSESALVASLDSELSIVLKNSDEYDSPDNAIVALAEFSGHGYEIIPALRAAWSRAVNAGDSGYSRAYELATKLYSSSDSDLLPRIA